MHMNNMATYNEIMSQTEAWSQGIEKTLASSIPEGKNYDQVIFTGCGSTYYLSIAAASLYQELTGRFARALPGGELLLNSQIVLSHINENHKTRSLLVAISRSGTTTETVKAVEKFKEKNGAMWSSSATMMKHSQNWVILTSSFQKDRKNL